MGEGEEDDAIDAGQWLKPGEEVLTDARKARGDVAVSESQDRGGKGYRTLNDPLAVYCERGDITPAQMRAGYAFFAVWRHGCLAAARYRHMNFGELRTPTELGAVFWMGEEYREAMKAIRGVPERRAAYDVCIEGQFVSGMTGFKSERDARRYGLPLLVAALEDLRRHFKARRDRERPASQ